MTLKNQATETIADAVRPYAKGKSDLVAGVVVEAGQRFVEWFMSPERVAIRRERRAERRAKRASQ